MKVIKHSKNEYSDNIRSDNSGSIVSHNMFDDKAFILIFRVIKHVATVLMNWYFNLKQLSLFSGSGRTIK